MLPDRKTDGEILQAVHRVLIAPRNDDTTARLKKQEEHLEFCVGNNNKGHYLKYAGVCVTEILTWIF
jgi:hypothetical protein